MKVIWEADDIVTGRRFGMRQVEEKWIIGYISSVEGPARYVTVSDQDGLVTDPCTREYLAQRLNADGYLPLELL